VLRVWLVLVTQPLCQRLFKRARERRLSIQLLGLEYSCKLCGTTVAASITLDYIATNTAAAFWTTRMACGVDHSVFSSGIGRYRRFGYHLVQDVLDKTTLLRAARVNRKKKNKWGRIIKCLYINMYSRDSRCLRCLPSREPT